MGSVAAVNQQRAADRVPPITLVLGAVASVQIGASLAKTLFDEVGPGGTVLLRILLAAVILVALWRPGVRGRSREEWLLIAVFGFCLAGMNFAFYSAIDRIPLGVGVTFEFVGPLGVAIYGSRRPLDLLWVVLAGAGILLLADPGGGFDGVGVALALLAGAFWAAYILVSARMGKTRRAPRAWHWRWWRRARSFSRSGSRRAARTCSIPRCSASASVWPSSRRRFPTRWSSRRSGGCRPECSEC